MADDIDGVPLATDDIDGVPLDPTLAEDKDDIDGVPCMFISYIQYNFLWS